MNIPVSLKSEIEHWNYNQAKNENIENASLDIYLNS